MNFIRHIGVLLLALMSTATWAQTVSGTVTDENNQPLPGATVIVEGTNNGTSTDFDGKYQISVNQGQTLAFSYVGYATQLVTVSAATHDVMLQPDNTLEEVVVTALGITREKKSLGYAQQDVSSESLKTSRQSDVANAIAGKVSGVQLIGAPSSGFGASQIRLRGDVNVLYVIDGVRIQGTGVFNPVNDINPEDIKSMSVLKGAAATALYGPEGSRGVVIVTTTSEAIGSEKSSITFDSAVEVGNSNPYLPDFQSEYGGGYKQTFNVFSYNSATDPASWKGFDNHKIPEYYADESWGPKLDGTLVREWDSWIPGNPNFGKLTPWKYNGGISEFFRNAVSTKNNINFLNSGEKHSLKLNYYRLEQELTLPNTERETNRLNLGLNFDVSERLNVISNISFSNTSTLNDPNVGYGSLGANFFQWWQQQLDVKKLKDYKQNGKTVSWNLKGPRDASPKYWDSPYVELYENLKNADLKSFTGNVGLSYKLNEFLSSKISLSKTYNSFKSDDRIAFELLEQPRYRERSYYGDRNLLVGQLIFTKKFNKVDLNAITGFELSDDTYEFINSSSVNGLTIPNFYSISTSVGRPAYNKYKQVNKNRGSYLTASLGYDNWGFIEGSFRRDWNSFASVSKNYVDTKSLSLSLIVSSFIPQNDILTYFKLRGGIAQGPNFPTAYATQETFNVRNSFAGKPVLDSKSTLANPDLAGAVRNEYEIGAELKLFQNKIGVDITYFSKVDDKLPVRVNVDPVKGISSVFSNEGKQSFKGIELGISSTPFRNDSFEWNTNLNFATLDRYVDKVSNTTKNSDERFLSSRWGGLILRNEEGKKWGAVYGRKVKEIKGQKVINSTGTGYVTEDTQFLGNYLPDFTGGFSNTFKYKNFDLAIDMDFQVGGKYFSTTSMFTNYSGLGIETVGNNDLGNPVRNEVKGKHPLDSTGKEVKSAVYAKNVNSASGGIKINGVNEKGESVSYYVSPQTWHGGQFGNISEFVHDASYLSIRNINFGYTLDKVSLGSIGLEEIRLSAYINNAFLLFSSLPHVDPSQLEQAYGDSSIGTISFREGGQLPSVRTYGFNVRLKF